MKPLKRTLLTIFFLLTAGVVLDLAFGGMVIGDVRRTVANRLPAELRPNSTPQVTTPCDLEAAHVFDPLRYAVGKEDEAVVGVIALAACSEAIQQFPNEGRFQFQKGRALRAMNRSDDAAAAFQAAASLGYQPAKFYLATNELDLYWQTEDETHLENARKLLDESSSSFPPAGEQLARLTFTTDGLRHPQIIEALYKRDWSKLQDSRILVIFFLNGMQRLFSSPFNPDGDNCSANMVDATVNFDLEHGMVGDPSSSAERLINQGLLKAASWSGLLLLDPAMGGEPEKWIAFFEAAGETEARTIAMKYGCTSPVTRKIYSGLLHYAKEKRPLSEYGFDLLLKGKGAEVFLRPGERITS